MLEWQTIKELISFAKGKIGKMSCEYIEAILSSRHTLWKIRLHIFNIIKIRRISSRLSMYAYWRHKESCESWWWLNKDQQGLGRNEPYIGEQKAEDLALRYRMWWRRGKWTFWVRDINHAMESHISLTANICWIKKSRRQGQGEASWLF
jgi:hypothetical protein